RDHLVVGFVRETGAPVLRRRDDHRPGVQPRRQPARGGRTQRRGPLGPPPRRGAPAEKRPPLPQTTGRPVSPPDPRRRGQGPRGITAAPRRPGSLGAVPTAAALTDGVRLGPKDD